MMSSRLVVTTKEEHVKMCEVHMRKDTAITRDKLRRIEKVLNNHCVACNDLGHMERIVPSNYTH